MKKCKMAIVAGMCATVLLSGIFTKTVAAAEVNGESITVKTVLSGTLPEKEERFVMEMAAENEYTPMPAGGKKGVYALGITGEGENSFPNIIYTKPGVYHYKIYQNTGSNGECIYDNTVYSLVVYVTNSEVKPDCLNIVYALYNEDMSEKLDDLLFHNQYKETPRKEETKSTPKTGDFSNVDLYVTFMLFSLMGLAIGYYKKEDY